MELTREQAIKEISRLAELISKLPGKQEEVKPEPKPAFKVGDRVKVRQWDDMAKEFKIDDDGGLVIPDERDTFVHDMKPLCGKVFAIEKIVGKEVFGLDTIWNITVSMLEPAPSINQCPEPYTLTESTTFKFNGNKTTCIIEIDGRKFKGCAKCDPADEWNEETGKHWAELRAQRKLLDACEKDLRKRGQHAQQ